jgi:DMSO/TMAO reductase YedYZ molybdopterin-dependent catalytic subunit
VTSERGRTRRAALAGALAAALGLAVVEVVGGLLALPLTPVLAVGQAVVALVPGALAERAIALLGSADKPALVAGVVLGALMAGAAVGVLASRRGGLGSAAAAGLALLGVVAVAVQPQAGTYDVLPALCGGLTAVVALSVLLDVLGGRAERVPRFGAPEQLPSRRLVLRVGAGVAGLSVAAAVAGRWLGQRRRGVEALRAGLRVPATPVVVPTGAELGVAGVSAWRTPVEEFYRIDTALAPPLVDPRDWRLRVHGLVDRELELDLDDLLARPQTESWVTLTCVSNEVGGDLAGNARWTGVALAAVLREAGVRPGADAVLSTSADGWTAGTPLAALTDGRDAMLAVAMDGRPLPVEHGFPVRMVVPGLYGFVSATKWVVDLEVTRFDRIRAYWTDRGWAEQAPIKTASRIDVPRAGASLPAGRTAVGGVAWAQHRGVRTVEVRVDGGAWSPARLAAVPSEDTWRQWVWEWDAAPGTHLLSVRATDATGAVQVEQPADPVPDGATGWHTVEVEVTG